MHLPRGPAVGILVPRLGSAPGRPEDLPFGRAALRLAGEGIDVVFVLTARDGAADGVRAIPGAWEPVSGVPLAAVYDRFPSQSRPDAHAALLEGLGDVPVANPSSLVTLCLDKLLSQEVLARRGVRMPEVEGDPGRYASRLGAWGAAFLKPRTGSFGRGIRRVVTGEAAEMEEASVLQQAVPPLAGWAGVSCRVLVQRTAEGWHTDPPVARRSRTDPVVNAARGAEVVLLSDAWPGALDGAVEVSVAAAEALSREPDGRWLVEVGVDVVLDPDERPWVVEVNGRPRGRLEILADRSPEPWAARHVEACARPLRYLARSAGG